MNDFEFCIFIIVVLLLALSVCLWVVKHREHFGPRNEDIEYIKRLIIPVHEEISNIEFFEADESYTEDKKQVFLCMRDSKGKLYDDNTLVYVALHEMAHVLCNSIGHTPEFDSIFDYLLLKAYELGIYDNTKPIASLYCGMDIPTNAQTYTFDSQLRGG
jgi:hypothetical protein